jgi:uncharacterized protein (DUF488 family)
LIVGAGTEIYTVGHSTHPIERFLGLLDGVGIGVVADVRRFPGSRRNPQFGAEALERSLREAGIGYASFALSLGGRRPTRRPGGAVEGPDNSAWTNASFRAYADYMSEAGFAAGLAELERLAREKTTAIMCAEAHPSRCHRRLIADALTVAGWEVIDLLADGSCTAHALSAHAVVCGGLLSYPGQPTLLGRDDG